jgi:hypothetical protein
MAKKNGIKASPHDLRTAITSNGVNQTLLKSVAGNGEYNEMVQVGSEAADVNVDFSSDRVEVGFMVRTVVAASTKDLTKKQIVDGTTAGKALDGIASLVTTLGLTKFTLPLGLLAAFIPQDKAPKLDTNGFVLDFIFPFGPDTEAEDKQKPESEDIKEVEVEVKFGGGFCCSDDDGDSFVLLTAKLDSIGQHAEASLHVWGDATYDPALPGKPQGTPGHCNYSGLTIAFPNGGEVEAHKTYRFHGTFKITVKTARGQLPIVLSFSAKAGAEPDNAPIFNDNVTSAWFEPCELVLQPKR